jgi:hypothetical protein
VSDIVGTLIARAETAAAKGLPVEVTEAEVVAYCEALKLLWPRKPSRHPFLIWGVEVRVLDGSS